MSAPTTQPTTDAALTPTEGLPSPITGPEKTPPAAAQTPTDPIPKNKMPVAAPSTDPGELEYFSHYLLSGMDGVPADQAKSALYQTSFREKLPVRLAPEKEVEPLYRQMLKAQNIKYDEGQARKFKQLYYDAQQDYKEYEMGAFNAMNNKSTGENSAWNLKHGMEFANRSNKVAESAAKKGLEQKGGMLPSDPRTIGQIIKEGVNSGEVQSGQFKQSRMFEEQMKGQWAKDQMAARLDPTTKDGEVDEYGRPMLAKREELDWGDGLKVGVDNQGNIYPIVVRATDNVYGVSGVVSDNDYSMVTSGTGAFGRLVQRAIQGTGSNVVRAAAAYINFQDHKDAYLENLMPFKLTQSAPTWTGNKETDEILDNLGFANIDFSWNTQASLTDRLLGQGYESQDSLTAKKLLMLSRRGSVPRNLDERGTFLGGDYRSKLAGVGDVTAQMIPQLAMGVLTGGTGSLMYSSIDGYAAVYGDYREQGYTHGEANVAGVLAGVVTGITGKLVEGKYLSKLFGSSAAAKEALEEPLKKFTAAAGKEVMEEAEKNGLKLTAEQYTEAMAKKLPKILQGVAGQLDLLENRLQKSAAASAFNVAKSGAKKVAGAGEWIANKAPLLEPWVRNGEGVQEVLENIGQIPIDELMHGVAWNGKIYDALGMKAPDRLAVDQDAMEQRRKHRTWQNFLAESMDSFILGQIGGGLSEAPIAYANMRAARNKSELQDLRSALIQHYADNGGNGLDKLRETAKQIGREGRWGSKLTREMGIPKLKDGDAVPGQKDQSENDYMTQAVLNEIELLDRIGRDSGIQKKLALKSVDVQQAVGSLGQLMNQGDLYARGMKALLTTETSRQERDELLNQLLTPGPKPEAGQPVSAQPLSGMSTTEWLKEVERRKSLLQAKDTSTDTADTSDTKSDSNSDSNSESKSEGEKKPVDPAKAAQEAQAKKMADRMTRASDQNAVGIISRYNEVADFYEAAKLEIELANQIDKADAADVAGIEVASQQLKQARETRQKAYAALEPLIAGDADLARVEKLAQAQLKVDRDSVESQNVYDGTLVRHATQEAFVRKHFNDILLKVKDPKGLTIDQQQRLFQQAQAIQDSGLIDEKGQVNGETLRRTMFARKQRLAQAMTMQQDQLLQQQQQAGGALTQTDALQQMVEERSAAGDLTPETGQALIQSALSLIPVLQAGSDVEYDQAETIGAALTEWAAKRQAQLGDQIRQNPPLSYPDWLAQQQANPDEFQQLYGDGTNAPLLDGAYQDWVQQQVDSAVDPIAEQVAHHGKTLSDMNLPEFSPVAGLTPHAMQVALGTTREALVDPLTQRNKLDDELQQFEDMSDEALGNINPAAFDELLFDVNRNIALAELNQGVNNHLYNRMVTGAPSPTAAPNQKGSSPTAAAEQPQPAAAPNGPATPAGWLKQALAIADQAAAIVDTRVKEQMQKATPDGAPVVVQKTLLNTAHRVARREAAAFVRQQAAATGIGALRLTLGKLAYQLGARGGNYTTDPRWAQVVDKLDQLGPWLKERFKRDTLKAAKDSEKWNGPMGATGDLYHQSDEAYREIITKSNAQLDRLRTLRTRFKEASANRGATDRGHRHAYLQSEADKLQRLVVGTSVFPQGDPRRALLAQADDLLEKIGLTSSKDLSNLDTMQQQLHQAEELLRQAFSTPALQQALAAELFEAAAQETGMDESNPERRAAEAYKLMLQPVEDGDTPVAGSMATLAALFGPNRAVVAGHFAAWVRAELPQHATGEQPAPSLEQEHAITQAVQALLFEWPFNEDHVLSHIREGQVEDKVIGDNSSDHNILTHVALLQGFAGAGKTQMASAPVVHILGALGGATVASKMQVLAVAQHEGQREGLRDGLATTGAATAVSMASVDELISRMNNDHLQGVNVVALDEATVLTRQQTIDFALAQERVRVARRDAGMPPLLVLMVGDPAQLVGESYDPISKTSRRDVNNHEIAYDKTLLFPRLPPLKQIYRTGFIIHDELQNMLRLRILSGDLRERANLDNLPVAYAQSVPGDNTTLEGAQYQTVEEQRDQIAAHIKQLEAKGPAETRVLKVIVSRQQMGDEIAALKLKGVEHPEKYVIAVDEVQGKTVHYAYVAVNERTSTNELAPASTNRALLVGISRAKQYASIRPIRPAFENKKEVKLAKFQDDNHPDRYEERGLATQERLQLTDKLAANVKQPVGGQPALLIPKQAPLNFGSMSADPTQTPTEQQAEAVATATVDNEVSGEQSDQTDQSSPLASSNTSNDLARSQADLDKEQAELDRLKEENRQKAAGIEQQFLALQQQQTFLPKLQAVATGFAGHEDDDAQDVADGESVFGDSEEDEEAAARSGEEYSEMLRQGYSYSSALAGLYTQAQETGDGSLVFLIREEMNQVQSAIQAAQANYNNAVRAALDVPDEHAAASYGIRLNDGVTAGWFKQEKPPMIDVVLSEGPDGEVRPSAIHVTRPVYDGQGNFLKMETGKSWTPPPGSYVAQIRDAQRFLRLELVAQEKLMREYSNRLVSKLAEQGTVLVSSFATPGSPLDLGTLSHVKAKSSFLRSLMEKAAKLTGRDKRFSVANVSFKNKLAPDGSTFDGTGRYRIKWQSSFGHGLEIQNERNATDFSKNVFAIEYHEGEKALTVGMVYRERDALDGTIRRLTDPNSVLDQMLMAAKRDGTFDLGTSLPVNEVKPPAFFAGNPAAKPRGVAAFRERMKEMGVGVSSPHVVTISFNDDFKRGGYSDYLGEIDAETGEKVEGGRKGISGRSVVFTSFSKTQKEIDALVEQYTSQGLRSNQGNPPAHQILAELRKHDVEMVLLTNRELQLSDYVSALVGTPRAAVTTTDQLDKLRASELDGSYHRRRTGEDGRTPVQVSLTTRRSMLSAEHARPTKVKEGSKPLDRRGIINKLYHIYTDPRLKLFSVDTDGNVVAKENLKLLTAEQQQHLTYMMKELVKQTQLNTTTEINPKTGRRRNWAYAYDYAPDFFLYLSYFDSKLGNQVAESWKRDSEQRKNTIQYNGSFGAKVRTSTFTKVGPLGEGHEDADEVALDPEDLLETTRDTKSFPTFQVNLVDAHQAKHVQAVQQQQAQPAPAAPQPQTQSAAPFKDGDVVQMPDGSYGPIRHVMFYQGEWVANAPSMQRPDGGGAGGTIRLSEAKMYSAPQPQPAAATSSRKVAAELPAGTRKYIKSPINGAFPVGDLSDAPVHDSLFEISVDPTDPTRASYRMNPDPNIQGYSRNASSMLNEAAIFSYDGGIVRPDAVAVTTAVGQLELSAGRWVISKKAKVHFQSDSFKAPAPEPVAAAPVVPQVPNVSTDEDGNAASWNPLPAATGPAQNLPPIFGGGMGFGLSAPSDIKTNQNLNGETDGTMAVAEAESIIRRLLGDMGDKLRINPELGFGDLFGAVRDGFLELNRGLNGLVEALTPRHEALHYVLQVMTPKAAAQVLGWSRRAMESRGLDNADTASDAEVEEWLAKHYPLAFAGGNRTTEISKALSWLPGPVMRFFLGVRAVYLKLTDPVRSALGKPVTAEEKLNRFLTDLELGRFRGERVPVGAGFEAKFALTEDGRRNRQYEALAPIFEGRAGLERVANWVEQLIYERTNPVRLINGQLPQPMSKPDAINFVSKQLMMIANYSRQYDGPEARLDVPNVVDASGVTPLMRSWAQRLMATTQWTDTNAESKPQTVVVLNGILAHRYRHISGAIKVNPTSGEATVDEKATSATPAVYDADNGDVTAGEEQELEGVEEDSLDTDYEAPETDSFESVEIEALSSDNATMGKSHYLEEKNKQQVEEEELRHHLRMTPLLERQKDGSYVLGGNLVDPAIASQLLRRASGYATEQTLQDGRDFVTYADLAHGLRRAMGNEIGQRHNVAASLLARFFNFAQLQDEATGQAVLGSRVLPDLPADVMPSFYELGYTGRADLQGQAQAHAEQAQRVLSQLYSYYVSVDKNDVMDADVNKGMTTTGEAAESSAQIKNFANSAMINQLYKFTKGTGIFTAKQNILATLKQKGFKLEMLPDDDGPTLYRVVDGQPQRVFSWLGPVMESNKPYGKHDGFSWAHDNGLDENRTVMNEYATNVFELLGALGWRGVLTQEDIKDLVLDTTEGDAGRARFNKRVATWLSQFYGQVLLENLVATPNAAALKNIGVTPEIASFFTQAAFNHPAKMDDVALVADRKSAVSAPKFSPTWYFEATQQLADLTGSVGRKPEKMYAYSATNTKIHLLQHGNAMRRSLRRMAVAVAQRLKGEAPKLAWLDSATYRNPFFTNRARSGKPLILGTVGDRRTGRKHALVSASLRELTQVAFEQLFLTPLAESGGLKMFVLGSPKSDKSTQFAHPIEAINRDPRLPAYNLVLQPGTQQSTAALTEIHQSFQSLFQNQVLPRLAKAGIRATGTTPAEHIAALNVALKGRSLQGLQKAGLHEGVDFYVKDGTAVVSPKLEALLLMPVKDFVASVEQSLDHEAGDLVRSGYTWFPKELVTALGDAEGGNQTLPMGLSAFQGEGEAMKVRRVNPANGKVEYNPLIKSFLLSKFVHTFHLETALVGPGLYFKNDEVTYAKRLIALSTNYQGYDLNVKGGLPAVSNLAVLNDEKLSDVLPEGDVPANGDKGRGTHAGNRYSYTDAAGQRVFHRVMSTDGGQLFAVLKGMAPEGIDAEKWAREKIYKQELHDGLGMMTMLHDMQSQRSLGRDMSNASMRKLINGGMGPDGSAQLVKNAYGKLSNEYLELGNEYAYNQVVQMLGGPKSDLFKKWREIQDGYKATLGEGSLEYRRQVVRGNADWVDLHRWLSEQPADVRAQYEEQHRGLSSAYSGVKVGATGHNNVMDPTYTSMRVDNQNSGSVTEVGQNLDEADIANITQENYIFSLGGMNWTTTQKIFESLGKLADMGLIDLQELLGQVKATEVFSKKTEEMLANLGNVGNTYSLAGARLNVNLPLLRNVVATAISSQIKARSVKQRFKGARLTVQCSTGRVNMYVTQDGRRINKRQLLQEGLATEQNGQLVPTTPDAFAVSELAFSTLRHADSGALVSAADAEQYAQALQNYDRSAESKAYVDSLAGKYRVQPMEVMAPRGLAHEFGIADHLDVHDVTPEYFAQRERERAAKALPEKKVRRLMAQEELTQDEAVFDEMLLAQDDDTDAEFEAEMAADRKQRLQGMAQGYGLHQVDAYRTRMIRENEDFFQARGQEVYQNFLKKMQVKVTRIPVTGLNSIQVAKIVGFYDSQMNTMLMPSQMQTVAGADNDGDMVTVETYDVRPGGFSWKGGKGEERNALRDHKVAAALDPFNLVQSFHPIDFSGLGYYKDQAIALDKRLKESAAGGGGDYGPLGRMYRHMPSLETMIKNQQGKSGVGPFVKVSQLYYQNAALLKELGQNGTGDFKTPIIYGQYQRTSALHDEMGTGRFLENMANGSLDNAKEDLLGWLNVNPQMWGAYSAMAFAQIPEAEIFRLLSHPYAKQVAEAAMRSTDVDRHKAFSVAEMARKILTKDAFNLDESSEELIPAAGFGYETLKKKQEHSDEEDAKSVETLTQQILAQQGSYPTVPDLEGIVNLNPTAGMADYMTRKFVVEHLFLFSQRGDELLRAQGVLRALEGTPGNDAEALSMMNRVLEGLGYKPSTHKGGIDGAIGQLETELLEGDDVAKETFALQQKYELVNMRLHVAKNQFLQQAVKAMVLDYRQRQALFIARQPVVQTAFKKMQEGNRRFFSKASGGMSTLTREFGRWLDARFLQDPRHRHVPGIAPSLMDNPYLRDLAGYDLGTLEGQKLFVERAGHYFMSLKTRSAQAGQDSLRDSPLIAALLPRPDQDMYLVELAGAENLSGDEKAALEGHFRRLPKRFGDEGIAVQQLIFRYALITKGLMPGRGSLAEVVSPAVARPYADFLGEQMEQFSNEAVQPTNEVALEQFAQHFALLQPQAAPEFFRYSDGGPGEARRKRSFWFEKVLPGEITEKQVRGMGRYRDTPLSELPQVLRIPNQFADDMTAVYEKVPYTYEEAGKLKEGQQLAEGEELPVEVKEGVRYERRYPLSPKQLNAYVGGGFAATPILEAPTLQEGQTVQQIIDNPATEVGKVVAGLRKAYADRLKDGRGIELVFSDGYRLLDKEVKGCKQM